MCRLLCVWSGGARHLALVLVHWALFAYALLALHLAGAHLSHVSSLTSPTASATAQGATAASASEDAGATPPAALFLFVPVPTVLFILAAKFTAPANLERAHFSRHAALCF